MPRNLQQGSSVGLDGRAEQDRAAEELGASEHGAAERCRAADGVADEEAREPLVGGTAAHLRDEVHHLSDYGLFPIGDDAWEAEAPGAAVSLTASEPRIVHAVNCKP